MGRKRKLSEDTKLLKFFKEDEVAAAKITAAVLEVVISRMKKELRYYKRYANEFRRGAREGQELRELERLIIEEAGNEPG